MKIKTYELFQVPPRWLFLKVETDEGIVGWGEPVIEGKAATVKAARKTHRIKVGVRRRRSKR